TSGNVLAYEDEALLNAAELIRQGKIVALKGIGGFQLICTAQEEEVVIRLRQRKRREEKPFPLMYPALDQVSRDCEVSSLKERLLGSPESPIVLLMRQAGESAIAPSVAPG